MGLAALVRSAVATADRVTTSLQPIVQHEAWIGQGGTGGPLFAAAIARPALVEKKQKLVRNMAGQEVVSSHYIAFLRPIEPNGAANREEPIDPRDRLTLPDGTTGAIAAIVGMIDKDTGHEFMSEIYLS